MDKWLGGACPVGLDTVVEFELRDGTRSQSRAGLLRWRHEDPHSMLSAKDVVAFRAVVPVPAWDETWLTGQAEASSPAARGVPPPRRSAVDYLAAAVGHIGDRADTYDAPGGERSIPAVVKAFQAITGHDLTDEQGWLFMALVKAVRSQQGKFRADSYEDGAAFFALAGESAEAARGGKC